MKLIYNESFDPYYNLALEEVVFNEITSDDVFLIWRSSPCMVFGKYQNIFSEANVISAHKDGVVFIRRESGGGTVYHDLGNINYAIMTDSDEITIDYDKYLAVAVNALNALGVAAYKDKACDIALCGKKISGSAQMRSKTRTLHHGTLLYNADLIALRKYFTFPEPRGTYVSKSIPSNSASVTNISDHLTNPASIEDFIESFLQVLGDTEKYKIDEHIDELAKTKASEKYRTWDWNFGRTPTFTHSSSISENGRHVQIEYEANHGVVQRVDVSSDFVDTAMAVERLINAKLDPTALFEIANELCCDSDNRELFLRCFVG